MSNLNFLNGTALTGFKTWECYMLLKYGSPGTFGLGGDKEYLIQMPLYPDEVTETIAASWTSQKILGRSAPIAAYAGTELKSVLFRLDLCRDLLTGMYSQNDYDLHSAGNQYQTPDGPYNTRTWYVNMNKMLQMSCYPQYTSSGLIPPTTYFVFGQMILKGFVQSYSTTWKKPIINTFYGWNSVDITMDCYPDTIISAKDMITSNRTGTASTQNTYNTVFPNNVGSSNVMTRSDTTHRSNARTGRSIGGSVLDV